MEEYKYLWRSVCALTISSVFWNSYEQEENLKYWLDDNKKKQLVNKCTELLGEEDLAEYCDLDYVKSIKLAFRLSEDKKMLLLDATVTTTVSLEDEAQGEECLAEIEEYLIGQYSDGWGEGFEQHELMTITRTDTIQPDVYGEEEYEEQVEYSIAVSPWYSRGFDIVFLGEV